MAHLRGSPEAAQELRQQIYSVVRELAASLDAQNKALIRLSESCHDESYTTMAYVSNLQKMYVERIMESMVQIYGRLGSYIAFIESLDTNGHGAVCSSLESKGIDQSVQAAWKRGYIGAQVKQYGQNWTDSLSREERAALRAYTGSSYASINAYYRGKTKDFDSEDSRNCAAHICSAMAKSTIPCDCVVYRGMGNSALGNLAHLSDEELMGQIYRDKGFMSTSINPEDAFGGAVRLEIEVPKGTRGGYVGYVSEHGHTESEVLLDRGQVMRFTNIRRDENGVRVIRARIISESEAVNAKIQLRKG